MEGTEGLEPGVGTPVVWDPELRLKAMDQEMVACEVLLPDDQNIDDPPFGSGLANAMVEGPDGSLSYEPELVQAGSRAYNRWLTDFCSADPNRLLGVTLVGTLSHVVWCVDEIERAYESGLRTAVMLPFGSAALSPSPLRHLVGCVFGVEPSGVVASRHGGSEVSGRGPGDSAVLVRQRVVLAYAAAVVTLIMGGILERYPKLHLIPTEMGVDWVPGLLMGLDMAYAGATTGMRASRGRGEAPGGVLDEAV